MVVDVNRQKATFNVVNFCDLSKYSWLLFSSYCCICYYKKVILKIGGLLYNLAIWLSPNPTALNTHNFKKRMNFFLGSVIIVACKKGKPNKISMS